MRGETFCGLKRFVDKPFVTENIFTKETFCGRKPLDLGNLLLLEMYCWESFCDRKRFLVTLMYNIKWGKRFVEKRCVITLFQYFSFFFQLRTGNWSVRLNHVFFILFLVFFGSWYKICLSHSFDLTFKTYIKTKTQNKGTCQCFFGNLFFILWLKTKFVQQPL